MLQKLEDHPLLYGCVGVVGLDDIDCTDRFYSLFKCNHGLVNRALLTIGDYSIRVKWRYQIGSADKNNTSWRALFHNNSKETHNVLRQLLLKEETFEDAILQQIIDAYLAETSLYDWKYYLVKYDAMRPEKYGMYYWYESNAGKKDSYNILMMMTEKSISGRNYQIFLKTLYEKFKETYPDQCVRLGEYAYSGDGNKLELDCIGKRVYFTDTELVIEDCTDASKEFYRQEMQIPQENGVDTVDRIDFAWNEIRKLI